MASPQTPSTLGFIQAQPFILAGSGSSIGDTTITLQSFTGIDGTNILTADLGSFAYGTLEPGNGSQEEAVLFTGVTQNSNGTATLTGVSSVGFKQPYTLTTGVTKTHAGASKFIISNDAAFYNNFTLYLNAIAGAGAANASTSVKGLVQAATAAQVNSGTATGSTGAVLAVTPDALAASNYAIVTPPGLISPYTARTAPNGWLMCDGSAVSRSTYSTLFAVLCPSGTFSVSIASPAVFTKTAHGYLVGDKLHFTTTGGLPSGLSTNTDYYIISAGLTTNAFEVALSPGGPAINTSGSQSGTHTVYLSDYGKGDGTNTFNVPDLRARSPIAIGQTSYSLSIDSSNVTLASPSVFTISADSEIYQGQPVVLTTSGVLPTGFTSGNTYYVIRGSQLATTITLAATQANANATTPIPIAGSGSQSGVHTLTMTPLSNRTILGRVGGEENDGLSSTELANHFHNQIKSSGSGGGYRAGSGNIDPTSNGEPTQNTGGDVPHNNMSPFLTVGGWIIKT